MPRSAAEGDPADQGGVGAGASVGGVTLYDVASLAGVSTATVSRVVHGMDRVRDTTRARVLEVIEQLGYVPDGAAQSLFRRRKDVIGLVGVQHTSAPKEQYDIESMSLLFYDEILRGVEAKIRHQSWSLLITYLEEDSGADLPRLLSLSGKVDGLLVGKPFQQPAHPILERDGGLEAKQFAGAGGVGHTVTDVAGAILAVANRLQLELEPRGERLRDLQHRAGAPSAEVDRVPGGALGLQRAHDPAHDVADMGEVARLLAILEDHRRVAVEQAGGEDRRDARLLHRPVPHTLLRIHQWTPHPRRSC